MVQTSSSVSRRHVRWRKPRHRWSRRHVRWCRRHVRWCRPRHRWSRRLPRHLLPPTVHPICLRTIFRQFQPKQTHPRGRSSAHRGKTAVITSSPYKSDLKKARSMSAGKGLPRKMTKTTKGKQQAPKKRTPSYGRQNRCLYCDELFEMTSNDDCIRCTVCHRWAHDQCAGVSPQDDYFTCELC